MQHTIHDHFVSRGWQARDLHLPKAARGFFQPELQRISDKEVVGQRAECSGHIHMGVTALEEKCFCILYPFRVYPALYYQRGFSSRPCNGEEWMGNKYQHEQYRQTNEGRTYKHAALVHSSSSSTSFSTSSSLRALRSPVTKHCKAPASQASIASVRLPSSFRSVANW